MYQKQPFAVVLQIGVLKNLAKFVGKHLFWSLSNKVVGIRPASFFKRDSHTGAFL